MAEKIPFYIRDIQTDRVVSDSDFPDFYNGVTISRTQVSRILLSDNFWVLDNRYMVSRNAEKLIAAPVIITTDHLRYEVTAYTVTAMDQKLIFQSKTPMTSQDRSLNSTFGVPFVTCLLGWHLARVRIGEVITTVHSGFKVQTKCLLPQSLSTISIDRHHGALSVYRYRHRDSDEWIDWVSLSEMTYQLAIDRGEGPNIFSQRAGHYHEVLVKQKTGTTKQHGNLIVEKFSAKNKDK